MDRITPEDFKPRIWRKFKPLNDALQNLNNRTCWSTCYDCNKPWAETATNTVSMIIRPKTGPESDIRYLCDNCVDKRPDPEEE